MSGTILRMLADTSIRASAAAFLVAGVLAAFRVRASGVRHASWTAVLFAMLLMPVLSYSLPTITLPFSVAVPPLPEDLGLALPGASQTVQSTKAAPGSARTVSVEPLAVRSDERTAESGEGAYVPRPVERPLQSAFWPLCVLGVYYVVAAAMLSRFLVGWWGAARITAASEPVIPPRECLAFTRSPRAVDIRESRFVTSPVAVGVLVPTILLPVTWRRWSGEKLRAVLAHESAHVHRRDLLVAFFAHLNRCLLWFHPLAWWLERTLAASAEQASDDIAMSAVGERGAYAEILLDMARAVGQRHGRIAWPGVGIDGTGLLNQRIERVLRGEGSREISAVRRSIVAVSCMSAIVIAVACRPSSPAFHENAAIERRDRALRAQLEQIERSQGKHFANVDWDAGSGPLESLEAAVRANPEDLDALQRFLVSYWVLYAPRPVSGWGNPLISNKVVDTRLLAARRAHILSLIERHPDSELADAVEARIFPHDLEPFFPGDPIGYSQAKALWLAHAHRPSAKAVVLGHAADFLEAADKPLAEQMLLRARALDPKGPWIARLGRLYAIALVGSLVPAGRNAVRTLSVAQPRAPYGHVVREKLGESTDDVLLTAAGWFLASAGSWRQGIDFNPQFWAESCFKRALQINPQGILAHTKLLDVISDQRNNREPLWRVPPASLDARIASLPEAERFQQMPGLAHGAYLTLESISRWDDPNLHDRREIARNQATRYAEETLKLAPKFRTDPHYGTAMYTANMTLSSLALRDGDKKKAVEYLRRASQAPASEELTYSDHIVSGWHIIRDLLAQGERQAVIDFLERIAHTNVAERIDLREAAAALRRGETPRRFRARTRSVIPAGREPSRREDADTATGP
jgi:beta-lactamase regulating signal transducer with metallopeptidase domain